MRGEGLLRNWTRTKILATVGPASDSNETLIELVNEGVVGFRLNYAHGDHSYFKDVISRIRSIERALDRPILILGDLQGPTVRLGTFDGYEVNKGDRLKFEFAYTSDKRSVVPVPLEEFFESVEENDEILIDDGKIEVKVDMVGEHYFSGVVVRGGEIRSKVTITIKGKELDLPPLSEKDVEFISFSLENDVDALAVSFVRSRRDVEEVKRVIRKEDGGFTPVISKIETKSAIDRLDEIISSSDGVLVARGDLGNYFSLEKIPKIQSSIVRKSLFLGKPTILATQILDSMIKNPLPTRAELTDIYNGVMEGVDAMLLSGETAVGKNPIDSVVWLRKTIAEAESFYKPVRLESYKEDIYDKFAKGVVFLAEELDATIVSYTKEGQTARRISRYRPKVTVYTFTNNIKVARFINTFYGVRALVTDEVEIEAALESGKKRLLSLNLLKYGDIILKTAGMRRMATDRIEVEEIR